MHLSAQGNSRGGPLGQEQVRRIVPGETMAAIATPTGEGAIALVRISGLGALDVADRIFSSRLKPSEFAPHVQHLGKIVDEKGRFIDEVLVSVHRGPASYTGEDLVEISCHGGILVTAKVLEACLRNGARAARPGEFTERAFLNGKMDLTQAEAVIDLIRARTDLALRSATEQLEGALGREIRQIRDEIVSLLAHLEASIDFAEEGISPAQGEDLQERLKNVRERVSSLLATAGQGRVLREGIRAVIYGPTNAGKSSLLNRLLGYDRVIVSEIHGTTRDTIEEVINMRGIPVRLVDTAGVRGSSDSIEREGIARTERSLQAADLILYMVDRTAPRPAHFDRGGVRLNEILILNKSDLPEHADWENCDGLRVSCMTGEGLPELEGQIVARISKDNLRAESGVAINTRHRDCLRRALEALERAGTAEANRSSAEYVAVDLNEALRAVGEVIGGAGVETMLDSLFSQFCIGK